MSHLGLQQPRSSAVVTREHFFFVPFVFFLGVLLGSLIARARLGPATLATGEGGRGPRVGMLGLVGPLVAFLVLFIATHAASHGGPGALEQALGGRPIFDQRASFSASEVYARIEAFGSAGRAAYARMTFTVDLVFPLVLLAFLVQLLRYVTERSTVGERARWLAFLLPVAWLLSDFAENAVIHRLLTTYPARHDSLAGALGALTYLKFGLLVGSLALAAAMSFPRRDAEGMR